MYGKDAYILAYLFDYKMGTIENKYATCGFPVKSLSKIESTLEQKKINYILLDRRNNYYIDYFLDNKNLNKYEEIYEKAYKYIKIKNRIQNINTYLNKNIEQKEIIDKIKEIEKILKNERWKI